MARSYPWNRWLTRRFLSKFFSARAAGRGYNPAQFRPVAEPLGDRVVPTVGFSYDPATLTLDIIGDDTPETITVSNDAGGEIFVNDTIDSNHSLLDIDTERVRVFGNGGSDQIDISSLNAGFLSGGASIDGGPGNDNITGSASNDVLTGGPGGDFINGGAGGNDRVVEQADANFDLDNGNLKLASGFLIENDTLLGVEQVELTGGPSSNLLDATGFSGRTILEGGGGADILAGGTGSDTLIAGPGPDSLFGGNGTDTVRAAGSTITLTDASVFVAAPGVSSFTDTLSGVERGELTGTAGNDTLTATGFTSGPVVMSGLDGNDALTGGSGNDTLDGGGGDDRLTGNGGNDSIIGGTGVDTVIASADTNFTLTNTSLGSAALGTDTLNGVEQANLTGGASSNTITASGFTSGPVTLTGLGGNDSLTGGSGNDSLFGGDGADTLVGGGGNDVLGPGTNDGDADSLVGGLGADTVREFFGGAVVLANAALSNPFESNTLSGVESADLTGSNGDDAYDVSGWTGSATVSGGSGSDEIVNSRDNSMTLTDASLDPGTGFITLVSIHRAHLTGGGGNNTLDASGFSGPVTLEGGGGDDRLIGGSASDDILGQGGDDTLTGGGASDTLDGGFGDDLLIESGNVSFTATNSTLTGLGTDALAGIDRINLSGGTGNNRIDTSAFDGPATLSGGDGDDTLVGGDSGDSLSGGIGNDSLVGNNGDDVLTGGVGNDTLTGGFGDDTLRGGSGNDLLLEAAGGAFTLTNTTLTSPGPGIFDPTDTDSVGSTTAGDFFERVQLTDTSTALFGVFAGHQIDAGAYTAGDVTLVGGDGDDTLTGGSGNDSLDGGVGGDSLVGGDGDDTLNGGPGNDVMLGGNGNDTAVLPETGDSITLGAGQDGIVVNGTAGKDVIIVRRVVGPDGPHAVVTVNGTITDVVYREGETVTVNGLGGNDLIVMDPSVTTWTAVFFGGDGNDTLVGAGLDDVLDGQDGNDDLSGGGGNDRLDGGDGNDRLDGGAGSDTMTGGAGVDRFAADDGDADVLLIDAKDKVKKDPLDTVIGP